MFFPSGHIADLFITPLSLFFSASLGFSLHQIALCWNYSPYLRTVNVYLEPCHPYKDETVYFFTVVSEFEMNNAATI